MTLEECRANIGKGVVYTPRHGAREDGVITSVSHIYAFVRYQGDTHSKATHPSELSPAPVGDITNGLDGIRPQFSDTGGE